MSISTPYKFEKEHYLSPKNAFSSNYNHFFQKQRKLIDTVVSKLESDIDSDQKMKYLQHIEQMMGKSSSTRKLVGSASYVRWTFLTGEFEGLGDLSRTEFQEKDFHKMDTAHFFREYYSDVFEKRDKEILDILKKYNSSYVQTYEEIIKSPFYFDSQFYKQ